MSEGPFSLWLTPDEASGEILSGLVARLADRFGLPVFEPHLTLLGSLRMPESTVFERAGGLAGRISPFALGVVRVGHGEEYFRSVYLEIGGDATLVEARSLADALLAPAASGSFDPHVSLAYGRLDASLRRRVVDELRGQVPWMIRVRALEVWYTGADVSWWRRVAAFELAGDGGPS